LEEKDMNSHNATPLFPPRMAQRSRRMNAIVDQFERIEKARGEMREAEQELVKLIREDPEHGWAERWEAFLAAGGVTVRELCSFVVQRRKFRDVVTRRNHLRLLVHHGN
jgi:hypothetical protein